MSEISHWRKWRQWTQARVGLKRAGTSVSTAEVLNLQWAHAAARDAVWAPWDYAELGRQLSKEGEEVLVVSSEANSRDVFLKRPDLGRRLSREGASRLSARKSEGSEIVFVISDGLSAKAIDAHFLSFWRLLRERLFDFSFAPLVLVPFGRVAVCDEIGHAVGARLAVIFVGERPGLSASDSLGVYLTYEPRFGRTDAERNCISNIRPPDGLSYPVAADKLAYLMRESLRLRLSGVGLKEEDPSIPRLD